MRRLPFPLFVSVIAFPVRLALALALLLFVLAFPALILAVLRLFRLLAVPLLPLFLTRLVFPRLVLVLRLPLPLDRLLELLPVLRFVLVLMALSYLIRKRQPVSCAM